jgi:probable HAF family extracellular repeat protein
MVAAAGILAVLAWACAAPAAQYTMTDLGTLGGSNTWATGINNVGQIVGQSGEHAFLYSGGVMQDLGTLGGSWSLATSINDAGQVVGASDTVGYVDRHAFLYSGGAMTDLGTLGGSVSHAAGINNEGQVVGQARTTIATDHAFVCSGGVMQDLGTLGGAHSGAFGINNAGQVVGVAWLASGAKHAFLYSGGVMTDLGTLGWDSYALGINNVGQVVGYSYTTVESTPQHAFLYSGGAMQDLGTLGGSYGAAYGINSAGQIVGESHIAGNAAQHAFLYSGGVMTDLNSLIPANSGLTLAGARSINDRGQIAGYAWEPSGLAHAILLTPTSPPPPPKLCAVLVGYGDPASEKWPKRTRGDEDAIAMYDLLSKYPGVRPENLWLLVNPSTSQDVQTIMQKAVAQLRPGDSLLFYYAGHGFTNDGWPNVANDEPPVPFGSVARLYGSGELNRGDEYLWLKGDGVGDISDDVLSSWLSCDPKMADVRKMVILDSCFAGGFWGTSGNDTDTGDLDKLNNIGLLAACGEGGVAYTVPGTGRGVFSLVVAEALELTLSGFPRADINLDGGVSFDELRYTVGLLYDDQHEGEAGLIRAFPWLEEPIESPIEGLGLYSLNSADYDTNAPTIPEPATLFLLAIGGWALLNRRRFTSS